MTVGGAYASSEVARQAVTETLTRTGNAIEAVIGGYFAAAGDDPGILLASAIAMVGGVGVGVHCYDGRSVQPGAGIARPRGFKEGESIPIAARVSVSRTVPMMAVMHAHHRTKSLAQLVAHGTRAAKAAGRPSRAKLISGVSRHHADAWRLYATEALALAGPLSGGILSDDDLSGTTPPSQCEAPVAVRGRQFRATIWQGPPGAVASENALAAPFQIAAADFQGRVAVISLQRIADNAPLLEDADIRLPIGAIPVRRGVPRTRPGTPCVMPAGVAILAGDEGWFGALASQASSSLQAAHIACDETLLAEIVARVRERNQAGAAAIAWTHHRKTGVQLSQ